MRVCFLDIMVFSELIKKTIKEKAHYKCCICESFGPLHVHHVNPEAEGGSDTEDNAAPLCVNCHDTYGGNPEKRKWIREKREFWFKKCEEILTNDNLEQLGKMYEIIEKTFNEVKSSKEDIKYLQTSMSELISKSNELSLKLNDLNKKEKPSTYAQIGSFCQTIAGTTTAMSFLVREESHEYSCSFCGTKAKISGCFNPFLCCPNCRSPMH